LHKPAVIQPTYQYIRPLHLYAIFNGLDGGLIARWVKYIYLSAKYRHVKE